MSTSRYRAREGREEVSSGWRVATRIHRAVAFLVALSIAAACGSSDIELPPVRKLELDARQMPPAVRSARESIVLAEMLPGDFEFVATEGRLTDGRWHPLGERHARVHLREEFDLGRINGVALELELGEAAWRAVFLLEGKPLVFLDVEDSVPVGGAFLLDVPDEGGVHADEFVLSFTGHGPDLSLGGIRFLQRPAAAQVPAPGAGVQLFTRERTTRPALGLFPGSPLSGRARIGVRDHLHFAVACAGTREVVVEVVARTSSGVLRHEVRATAERSWTSTSLDLATLGVGDAEFEFRMLAGDACAISEPTIAVHHESPPTVLLITSDTHRGDHLGFAGMGVRVETPTLDRFAAGGTAFLDARSLTHITNPSHISMFTGVHPLDHGIFDNSTPLTVRAHTLAEVFAEAGWATVAATSASHLGHVRSGLGQGFEIFFAPLAGDSFVFDSIAPLEALLPEMDGRPTFVWLHLFDAHSPYRPSQRWREHYVDADHDPYDAELPEPPRRVAWDRKLRDLSYLVDLYRAEVSEEDEKLARVFDHPRFQGAWIAFTGDHGERLGVHDGVFGHRTLDPACLHVPLVFGGPGVASGVRSQAVVTNQDIGRTLLDLAGLEEHDFPGRNLLRTEHDPHAARFAVARYRNSVSIERDGWLLVRHLIDQTENGAPIDFREGQEQLFHIDEDRECREDLLQKRPERAGELRRELEAYLANGRQLEWGVERIPSAAELSELEALGYAGSQE